MAAPDPTEFGRKIRQHDNEVEAIYDLLQAVDGKIAALDIKVDTGFEDLNAKFDALDTKVDTGFERLESTQRQILELLRGRDSG